MNWEASPWPEWERLYSDDADESVGIVLDDLAAIDASHDLTPHRASLTACLREARESYLTEYWDWLGRSTAEGSEWRPYRDAKRNPGDTSPYDYGEFSAPPDAWQAHWDEFFAKPIAASGNRARNPSTFRGLANLGPPLGKPMLAGVYHRLYRWWRTAFPAEPFRPNFVGMVEADSDADRLAALNFTARLFFLFASEVDLRFTMTHCARVALDEESFQNASKAPTAARKNRREKARRQARK